jgi:hypothetical protein
LLLVIRHARAGERSEWEGDDRLRRWTSEATAGRGSRRALAPFRSRASSRARTTAACRRSSLSPPRAADGREREELGEERQGVEGVALARSLVGEPVAICVHGGLSDAAFGERQKKGETFVVDGDGRVVQRIRP